MKAVLVNFNFTPTWLLTSGLDYHIYDRSDNRDYLKDFPQDRITVTENIGNVDLDKLTYLIDHYDHLPDVFLWGKTNLFKYISQQEFDVILSHKNLGFTPLLTQFHKTYSDNRGVVCYYENGMYHERNDSWFLGEVSGKYVNSFNEWAAIHHFNVGLYIPFAPGGNYILTRETVHKYGVDYYIQMRDMLNYTTLPGEAQCAERSYFLIWS